MWSTRGEQRTLDYYWEKLSRFAHRENTSGTLHPCEILDLPIAIYKVVYFSPSSDVEHGRGGDKLHKQVTMEPSGAVHHNWASLPRVVQWLLNEGIKGDKEMKREWKEKEAEKYIDTGELDRVTK